MKDEYMQYARKLYPLGQRFQKFGDDYGSVTKNGLKSFEDIKKAKSEYKRLLQGFIVMRNDLEKIAPPSIINNEHNELVNNYDLYYQGTNEMADSLKVEENPPRADTDLYKHGLEIQTKATKNIVALTKIITAKFNSN
jgi:hypothetical protein